MKLVVQVKLLPTPMQAAALEATLRACNEAAGWASEVAFHKDVKRNFALREHTYAEIKARWGLGAQAAQHVIKKVCDAYATLKANLKAGNLGKPGSKRYRRDVEKPIAFRVQGAQPYDDRMLSWQIGERRVSIWTVHGRVKDVAFTASPEQLATLALYRKGESDLVCRDGMWFLLATCEVPEAPLNTDPVDFLGVDLGIVNIATTSDGEIMAGRELNRIRMRERTLRTKLQKKNTPSAKRRLNKRRRKESRRAKDINHKIAKHVVAEAERTGRGIALEELTGIRERVRLQKPQRATHSSWSFAQLGAFIAYKARRAGVPVVYVDPAYTSRTCAECGHVDKANRVSQAWFACRSCGVVAHADRNGSRNVRARAWGLWRRGAESTAPAPPPSQRDGAGRKRSITASDARCASPGTFVPGS
ncbi:IS200/IS605 family element transposase accessory protein TnpB [Streptomyces sp. PSKA54]|uniref:IS200/IS605 family element transposase accessory protein TnpB n=2 Tax=Streptomyces himalayensis subsp. aureolus TaxID=2758039 RepID=A0A7W2D5U2_9ACTN|nr:RNA-guided endonuclease TnpB family protein [Streptomyces himalayensis]MBA4865294.1 IS200/IS605 family element transposase accessory protein TnpB [Streptomyces himalayensis subsp. aureolus]